MSKTSTLFKYSALALVIGLSACDKSNPGNDDPLTCIAPQILNEAGDACIDDANALVVPAANQAVVYYKRQDGDYDGWGLHLWGDDMAEEGITWGTPLLPDGVHPLYGAYFLVDLTDENWTGFNFIVHNGDAKDIGGADLVFDRAEFGDDVFSFQGVAELFADPIEEIPVMLSGASAHFIDVLDADGASIMFPARVESNAFKLWHSPTASLVFDEETKTVSGGTAIDMALEPMSETQQDAMPHLKGLTGFWVDTTASEAKSLLKEQLWVVESNADGEAVQLTRVQTPNVLDALYATAAQDAQLGAYDNSGVTHFALWAPTAQSVSVQVFNAPTDLTPSETIALTEDTTTGIWGADASSDLTGKYYIYDISVFHHATDAIESYTVTDPYSLSLSTNSLFSQVVDLDDVSLQPAGGWTVNKAFTDVTNPEDISVYETHVRDITLWDGAGTEALNGKFKAFTESSRESMQHLQALRNAGMTAVQILPAFDIATIDEDESMRVDITDTMADYCAISTDAAAKAAELSLSCDTTVIETALGTLDVTTGDAQDFYSHLRGVDSFNWGYDPFHYTVPEGSY
ncbi:MAG: pullulanase-associated domain-containing protein, partial [Reinekea sp.]|nr:pullulanase-associated domain-containing protein [Reinekea sp.]